MCRLIDRNHNRDPGPLIFTLIDYPILAVLLFKRELRLDRPLDYFDLLRLNNCLGMFRHRGILKKKLFVEVPD